VHDPGAGFHRAGVVAEVRQDVVGAGFGAGCDERLAVTDVNPVAPKRTRSAALATVPSQAYRSAVVAVIGTAARTMTE
jgi:hypothetical protein